MGCFDHRITWRLAAQLVVSIDRAGRDAVCANRNRDECIARLDYTHTRWATLSRQATLDVLVDGGEFQALWNTGDCRPVAIDASGFVDDSNHVRIGKPNR